MQWDNITIRLCIRYIQATLEKKNLTSWEFTKEEMPYKGNSYEPAFRKKQKKHYNKHNALIISRLKQLEDIEIVNREEENGNVVYTVDTDRVYLKTSKFPDNKKRNFLCVRYIHGEDTEEKWDIFEI